jgi:hypothetical protein
MLHAFVVVHALCDLVLDFDRGSTRIIDQANGPREVDRVTEADAAIDHHVHINALRDGAGGITQFGRSQQRLCNSPLVTESPATKVDRVEADTPCEGGGQRVQRQWRDHQFSGRAHEAVAEVPSSWHAPAESTTIGWHERRGRNGARVPNE